MRRAIESITPGSKIRFEDEDIFVVFEEVSAISNEPDLVNVWVIGDKLPTRMRKGELIDVREEPQDFPFRGTISHGTLRTQDLIETFMRVLRELSPGSITPEVADQERRALNACDGTYVNDPAYSAEDVAREQDGASEFLTWAMDQLDALAPEGFRFGTCEGDGSDFGFWIIDDEEGVTTDA